MKLTAILIIFTFTFTFVPRSLCQSDTTKNDTSEIVWKTSTAITLPIGRSEISVFSPFSIGLKNNMEITVIPIMFFVMPNGKLKKNWSKDVSKKWQFATEHSFTIPTLMLNLLSTEGTIGIYPPTEKAPPIFTLRNRFIGSYFYKKEHAISFKTGFEVNLLHSQYGDFPEVELLYIYPRTAAYSNPYVIDAAIGLSGGFTKKWGYDGDLTMFYIPTNVSTWVFEFNPKLYYNFSNKFRMSGGIVLTAGNVPHEKQNFRALPFVDFSWSMFQKNRK